VAGRLDEAQSNPAHSDLFAIAHGSMRKLGASLFAENDLCTRASSDLLVSAYEVSVKVRLDHVFDPQPLRVGFGEVLVNITLRIDNSRFTLRTNQVRSMGQAREIELFEIHIV
jgi:hypothetical protein